MADDRTLMLRALELAARSRAYVTPNPMVGAVIARRGRIIAEGRHERYGGPHAEVNALSAAGEGARGATLYVTLEPCFEAYPGKKTPPCAPLLAAAGLKRVVIAASDPHPNVRGRGAALLREAGTEVEQGLCEEEARELNAAFFHLHERGRPLVTAKWAMTLDGKIATRTGESRWISSEAARVEAHEARAASGAVVVGIGTAARDDPLLTARLEPGREEPRQPLRVVMDSELKLSPDSQLARTAKRFPVLVCCGEQADAERRAALEGLGIEVLALPRMGGHLDWHALWKSLAARGVSGVLLEGGGSLIASALAQHAVDRVKVFVAPLIFGGNAAPTPVGGEGIAEIERALRIEGARTRAVGPDIVVEGEIRYPDA
jgi:diaminohydroxyphosphoribosylaminopyrimidine deaminase / 5-amino-6-(5-phosphoribosylamino)uracil reductase